MILIMMTMMMIKPTTMSRSIRRKPGKELRCSWSRMKSGITIPCYRRTTRSF